MLRLQGAEGRFGKPPRQVRKCAFSLSHYSISSKVKPEGIYIFQRSFRTADKRRPGCVHISWLMGYCKGPGKRPLWLGLWCGGGDAEKSSTEELLGK
jgi:hypothetical protein